MCLNQIIIFHFQSRKGTSVSLRQTNFFDFVTVMPNHTLKASNVLLTHAVI